MVMQLGHGLSLPVALTTAPRGLCPSVSQELIYRTPVLRLRAPHPGPRGLLAPAPNKPHYQTLCPECPSWESGA